MAADMGTELPLVSAVIPTRNRPEIVCRAVRSALAQTYANLEVVVVIDGPDLATESALEGLNEPRLRIIALAENVGGGEARNIGVRQSKGSWIAFLDDDDEWSIVKIELQIALVRSMQPQFSIVACRVLERTDSTGSVHAPSSHLPKKLYAAGQDMGEYLFCCSGLSGRGGLIQTSTILGPRQLFIAVPFQKGLRKHQDWDWILRAARFSGFSLAMLPESLAIFDRGGARSSISRSLDWMFSLEWATTMRPLMSPNAYTHFIVVFCAYCAKEAGDGLKGFFRILGSLIRYGRPGLSSVSRLLFFSSFSLATRLRLAKASRIASLLLHRQRPKTTEVYKI